MGRLRAATATLTGGFDRQLRAATAASTGGFDRRLRAATAASSGGGGGFDRRRLGLAREEEACGGKCGGEEIDRCGPN
jgi:hypothetical protein